MKMRVCVRENEGEGILSTNCRLTVSQMCVTSDVHIVNTYAAVSFFDYLINSMRHFV